MTTQTQHTGSGPRPGGSRWFRGSLTRRVLGSMLALSLVPLLVMAYQGYHCAGQALVEQTQAHLDAMAAARATLIGEWLAARNSELRLLAASVGEGAPGSEAFDLLEAVREAGHGYAWIALFDAGGRVLAASAADDAPPVALPAEPPYGILAGGEIRTVPAAGQDAADVMLAHPTARGGSVVGRLHLSESFQALLSDRNGLGKSGRVYVASEDLDVLSAPAPAKADPEILHVAAGHRAGHGGHGFLHLWPVTPETLRSAVAVPGTDWIVVTEADPKEALAWLGILRTRAVATGVVTLVVLVFVALGTARALGRPLRELARVAQRVRSGRVEERLGPMGATEAEEVRQAFNQMLDDLREKQRELVRAATLASVGELSSSIVHEMRNPLSSIKMNLQALRRQVDANPAYRELAEIASEQVRRVESMLDDLLKYGRPVELRTQETSFRELADAALAVVGDAARAKGITLELEDGLNGHRMDVDREQMCRALTNLLLNAVQATPEGGRVTFAGRPADGQAAVTLEVLDTGPGLPAEARERLFRPFFTTKPNGTGLGLANVKKIVELHDGSVSASTAPSGGARFAISLPLRGAPVGDGVRAYRDGGAG